MDVSGGGRYMGGDTAYFCIDLVESVVYLLNNIQIRSTTYMYDRAHGRVCHLVLLNVLLQGHPVGTYHLLSPYYKPCIYSLQGVIRAAFVSCALFIMLLLLLKAG